MQQPRSLQAPAAGRYAFAAVVAGNVFLAAGPWMVRAADVGPVAAGFWRLALAVPFLALLAFWQSRGRGAPSWPLVALIALAGLFFALDLAAWHEGIVRTKLANATLFGNMSSFIFALYGFIVARSLPRPAQGAALLIAAIGAALLMGSSYELSPTHFAGDLLALLAAFFYALYLIVVDRARRTMAPMPVLAIATAAGAMPILALALVMGEQVMPTDWTPVLLLALGSQVIGQGLVVYAVGHLSPVVVGIGLLTQPVAAALIGWMVYDETFSAADAAGAVLIAASLILIRLPARLASNRDAAH
ncbi:MAG: DMT family transporter [Allosphingosinicella sp.]|uniref:DMT family transporter n=1 Tax=Allosphingosinicella sp. TaxID=2823234 RepID=UPI0039543F19